MSSCHISNKVFFPPNFSPELPNWPLRRREEGTKQKREGGTDTYGVPGAGGGPYPSQRRDAPPSLGCVGCVFHGARRDSGPAGSHRSDSSSSVMDGQGVRLRFLLRRNWLLVATVSSVLLGTSSLPFPAVRTSDCLRIFFVFGSV